MSKYRDEVSFAAREGRWTFFRVLPLFLLVVAVITGAGFGLRSLGLWGGTVVERKVFENSYQRSEGLKSSIALDEATLAEIEAKLEIPGLDNNTRANLEAQAAAARIRINTAKRMQHE